jgi:K+/H+ antiporter YhaU regulatory subunit KhtT
VVNHPVRRRIVLMLMVAGSAGVVTAVASLIFSFGGASGGAKLERAGILIAGLVLLWLLSRSAIFERALAAAIAPLLHRAGVTERDFAALLELEGDYAVHELAVEQDDWVSGQTLRELKLRDEGVVVLGIRRPDGGYEGAPHGTALVDAGDTLILYGTAQRIAELDERRRGREGDRAHRYAVSESVPSGGSAPR